jgi:hypothetical protein
MAPFQAWKDVSPVDSFLVRLDETADTHSVADIQLFVDYAFTYRPNGSLPA